MFATFVFQNFLVTFNNNFYSCTFFSYTQIFNFENLIVYIYILFFQMY